MRQVRRNRSIYRTEGGERERERERKRGRERERVEEVHFRW